MLRNAPGGFGWMFIGFSGAVGLCKRIRRASPTRNPHFIRRGYTNNKKRKHKKRDEKKVPKNHMPENHHTPKNCWKVHVSSGEGVLPDPRAARNSVFIIIHSWHRLSAPAKHSEPFSLTMLSIRDYVISRCESAQPNETPPHTQNRAAARHVPLTVNTGGSRGRWWVRFCVSARLELTAPWWPSS